MNAIRILAGLILAIIPLLLIPEALRSAGNMLTIVINDIGLIGFVVIVICSICAAFGVDHIISRITSSNESN